MFGFACDRWEPRGQTVHKQRGFAGRVRLIITSPPVVPGELDGTQRDGVRAAVLDAAALWVRACRECKVEHLSVIDADGPVYLRAGLARWLESPEAGIAAADPEQAEKELKGMLENNVFLMAGERPEGMPAIRSLEPYVLADTVEQAVRAFCALTLVPARSATVASVHAALCRPIALPAAARAKIMLRFRTDGATYCGTDREIIACRADNSLTEFNSRDIRFRVGGDVPAIGRGEVEMDLLPVVLHEMGHWIGLEHIDRGESIMASTADRARCIDETTVSTLSANLGRGDSRPAAFRLHAPRSSKRHRAR